MSQTSFSERSLEPLPYHQQIRAFLAERERDVWQWFHSNRTQEKQAEKVRFELLKSTYRLERSSAETLYRLADQALDSLALDVPLTLYQAQNAQGFNASLVLLTDEAHVVLHGDLASLLDEPELLALLGHELAHLLLARGWQGDYLVTEQILAALSLDPAAESAHLESVRLFDLYTEVFCDRGSLQVAGQLEPVVRAFVKTETGVRDASAESYLRQAEEIFAQENVRADQLTHPETFIRCRALQLWYEQGDDANEPIAEMIEGKPRLDSLDLLAQRRISELTRRLIGVFLTPLWMRTDATLNHARSYFDDFDPDARVEILDQLAEQIQTDDENLKKYYCYLLMDFVTVDRDLEEYPLASAIDLADRLGLLECFEPIALKELRLRKKQLARIVNERHAILRRVEQEQTAE